MQRGYVRNVLNQYQSAGQTGFGYDGRGNLTSSSGPGGTVSYEYTLDNLLARARGSDLVYDALDRLSYQGASNTTLRYAGDQLTTEQSGGGVLRRYALGAGGDEPVVWYEGAGANDRRWLYADERGSVVAVANQSGDALAINTYDEYGIPGSANLGRFQYTGQTWLAEAQLYHYKARAYSPTLGRFLQPDPLGYDDGMNMYDYVGGSPMNATDPTGMSTFRCEACKPKDGGTGPGAMDTSPNRTMVDGDTSVITGERLKALDLGAFAGPPSSAAISFQSATGNVNREHSAGEASPQSEQGDIIVVALRSTVLSSTLRRNGVYIGRQQGGASPEGRTVSPTEFQAILNRLLRSGAQKVTNGRYPGQLYRFPDGGTFGTRFSPQSGLTLDINDPNLPKGFKIHQRDMFDD